MSNALETSTEQNEPVDAEPIDAEPIDGATDVSESSRLYYTRHTSKWVKRLSSNLLAFKGSRADIIAAVGYFSVLLVCCAIMLHLGFKQEPDVQGVVDLVDAVGWLTLAVAALKLADKTGNRVELGEKTINLGGK